MRIQELSPRFRRIVVSAEELAAYTDPLPGEVFRLFLPPPGHNRPVLASIGSDGFPYWPDGVPRPFLRTYYVRSSSSAEQTLTFDAALWGGASQVERLRPGAHVHVWGFRDGFELPPEATQVILIGDAGALPGMAAILEALPGDVPATVFAEAPTRDEQSLLPERPRTQLHWTTGSTSQGADSALERLVHADLPRDLGQAVVRIAAEMTVAGRLREVLLAGLADLDLMRTIPHWHAGMTSDQRDATWLPRIKDAAARGLDLQDLDVWETLELALPLPEGSS